MLTFMRTFLTWFFFKKNQYLLTQLVQVLVRLISSQTAVRPRFILLAGPNNRVVWFKVLYQWFKKKYLKTNRFFGLNLGFIFETLHNDEYKKCKCKSFIYFNPSTGNTLPTYLKTRLAISGENETR